LRPGPDGRPRCWWGAGDPLYAAYHDAEWGRPAADDCRLFEKLCLEGFQAGLSWLTILRKRPNFRRAFKGFDPRTVARFNRRSVGRLLVDAGIVRHRGKIESTIHNARRALEVIDEWGSLAAYVWSFEPPAGPPPAELVPHTSEARGLARDLKQRGFTFVGPTTTYAFMQAMGLVNDHLAGCCVREEVERERAAFRRP
jgi:DNA-3-methyladenine glycosylase I